MVRFPPRRQTARGLNMTPLLDVVFLLLLFFMLTSSFAQPAIALKLPEGTTGRMPEAVHVVVTADAQGNLLVNRTPVTVDGLEEALREALAAVEPKEVHFRADRSIPFGLFVSVLDAARKVGALAIPIHVSDSPEAR